MAASSILAAASPLLRPALPGLIAVLLAGCATPAVVPVRTPEDARLDCPGIEQAFTQAQAAEQQARSDRGLTGTNVAAGLFFWPGLIGTFFNTEEAIDAATARQRYLMGLASRRGCPIDQPPEADPPAPAPPSPV